VSLSISFTSDITPSIKEVIKTFPLIDSGQNAKEIIEKSEYIEVAIDNSTKKIVGYLILEPKSLDQPINLHYIEVCGEYRHQNIGSYLVAHAISYAREKRYDRLSCMATNESKEFFQKMGFAGENNILEIRLR
jgi:N-acetylglutamate synthase-like GNAT family acetyltransferase